MQYKKFLSRMADKNRNFRSSYYDKVGFRGVEEKKSLEKLITEKPMAREKLSKFCMRFTLPSMYRELVWKVLLGLFFFIYYSSIYFNISVRNKF